MTQRDLFGGRARADTGLREPVELDCEVTVIREFAVQLKFISPEGQEGEAWCPRSLLRFRGNGQARMGAQVLDIERFKAREIGAI